MGRIVAVQRGLVLRVVPVMEIRRHDHVAQRPEANAHVRVVEDRLEAHDDDVRIDHALVESQHVDRGEDQSAREDELEDVLARAREPIHALGAVMDGMQAPQDRHLMVCAMRPVLHQVCHEQDQDHLQPERQAANPFLQRGAEIAWRAG